MGNWLQRVSTRTSKPSAVDVYEFMQAGTWTMVYATVPTSDPGYFFFDSSAGKRYNLKMSGEGSHKKK